MRCTSCKNGLFKVWRLALILLLAVQLFECWHGHRYGATE